MSAYYRLLVKNAETPGILDTYPAASAFSVAKLKIDATNCMDVRRSTDNATLTVGFVNGMLDTATLLAWAGSASVFVTKWYDQQGGLHATQTIANSQPKIVNAGVLCVDGDNKPSLLFPGASVYFNLLAAGSLSLLRNKIYAMALVRGRVTNTVGTQASAYFSWTITNTSPRFALYNKSSVANTNALYERRIDGNSNTSLSDPNVHDGATQHITVIADYANNVNKYRLNGAQVASAAGLGAGSTSDTDSLYVRIGNNASVIYHVGNISELIVYNANTYAADIASIESNRMAAFA